MMEDIIKRASKFIKPMAPKTASERVAAGETVDYRVPATDPCTGALLTPNEVFKRDRLYAMDTLIPSHEKTIAASAGLRGIEELTTLHATAQENVGEAHKHWELMQRRWRGGMAEMSDLEAAQQAFNTLSSARNAIGTELNKVKAAAYAQAEISRLKAEYAL